MPESFIRFSESAVADLEGLRTWYADQRLPDVGNRLVKEIFVRIETLRDHPDIGRVVPEFDQPFLRELIHPPFRILYRPGSTYVQIVRARRSERLLELPKEE